MSDKTVCRINSVRSIPIFGVCALYFVFQFSWPVLCSISRTISVYILAEGRKTSEQTMFIVVSEYKNISCDGIGMSISFHSLNKQFNMNRLYRTHEETLTYHSDARQLRRNPPAHDGDSLWCSRTEEPCSRCDSEMRVPPTWWRLCLSRWDETMRHSNQICIWYCTDYIISYS